MTCKDIRIDANREIKTKKKKKTVHHSNWSLGN